MTGTTISAPAATIAAATAGASSTSNVTRLDAPPTERGDNNPPVPDLGGKRERTITNRQRRMDHHLVHRVPLDRAGAEPLPIELDRLIGVINDQPRNCATGHPVSLPHHNATVLKIASPHRPDQHAPSNRAAIGGARERPRS